MTTLTFIAGMERFNAHVWDAVTQALQAGGVNIRLLRFNDDHVERRDPAPAAAIAEADVVFITLINMRANADWLTEQLGHANPRAVFAFESMPEVMALNRVGSYRVQGGKGSLPKPMQLVLKLLTQGREEDTLYAYTKLTKITSKLLPLMPAKLHDFRTWLSVNIYWNQPDAANITQMIRLILRDCLGQPLDVAPPRLIPMMGCFHPDTDELFANPIHSCGGAQSNTNSEKPAARRKRMVLVRRPSHYSPSVSMLSSSSTTWASWCARLKPKGLRYCRSSSAASRRMSPCASGLPGSRSISF